MKANDKDNVRELGDIALLLHGQLIGHRTKTESAKDVREEMEPYHDRILQLLEELGV